MARFNSAMRLLPAVLLCLSSAVATAAAATPLRATLAGAGTRMIGSDGARFAAWQDGDVAATFVYDGVTRKTTRLTPPAGCTVTGIGAGALVATCDIYPFLAAAEVLDLPDGQWRQVVPPADDTSGFGSRLFVGIGTHWIEADRSEYHLSYSAFYAREDGSRYAGPAPFGPHVQPALDAPQLRRRVCSPLRAPVQLEGRFALRISTEPARVVLRRCGSARRRVVCRNWCFTPTLFHGRVLWADDYGRLHVRGVRARRTRTFVIRNHPIAGVYPAGRRLVFATDVVAGTERIVVRSASVRALRTR
jgi:hypothetical protein